MGIFVGIFVHSNHAFGLFPTWKPRFLDPRLLGMLLFIAPMVVSYLAGKSYHQRRDLKNAGRAATDGV